MDAFRWIVGGDIANDDTPGVVVTLSFNAKIVLADFKCNLGTRDSQKWLQEGNLFFVGM